MCNKNTVTKAAAPMTTPTLSAVWVDGCADQSVPGSSLTVVTAAAAMNYIHIQRLGALSDLVKHI